MPLHHLGRNSKSGVSSSMGQGGGERSRIGEASAAVGALAARRPCAVIWTMVAWSFLLILGLATMKVQTDGLWLWIPTRSEPYKNMVDMIDRFGEFRRNEILILYPKVGTNVLTRECLQSVLAIHDEIVNTVESDDGDVTFADVCYAFGSGPQRRCDFWNPLALFDYDAARIDFAADYGMINGAFMALEASVPVEAVLGSIVRDENGTLVSAGAMIITYATDADKLTRCLEWELGFLDRMFDIQDEAWPAVDFVVYADRRPRGVFAPPPRPRASSGTL